MKILIMTYCNKEALEISLGMLTGLCHVEAKDIIIASLNAGDAVTQLLTSQEQFRYILADESDSYGAVINTVINEFLGEGENLAILNEGMTCFPDTFLLAEKYISEKNAGAIIFDVLSSENGEYAEVQKTHCRRNLLFPSVGWGDEGMVISQKMISENGSFDEDFLNHRNTLVDYLFRCGQNGYKFYKASDCVAYTFCRIPTDRYASEQEVNKIRDKWGMNYFTYMPNRTIINVAPTDYKNEVNVLEIGCDCGGNGAGVKEIYPDCRLYGLELNPNSARIASTVYDDVIVGNAEEMELPFGDIQFDIIIFGDVLEHLRDPLGILKKCYSRMKKGGVILASIPNLMHCSVMRQIINGRFQYENEGLLDKTHIHFFTYYEILKIFQEAEFEMEEVLSIGSSNFSKEDEKLIDTLVSLSTNTNRSMYKAFEYVVRAKRP